MAQVPKVTRRTAEAFESGVGDTMATTETNTRFVQAPGVLGLETRGSFREQSVAALEQMVEGEGVLTIDFAATHKIDSAGLGALMLIQRKAAERRQRIVLRGLKDEFRFLLVLTKLDDLFEIESNRE